MKGSIFYQKDRGRWAISWYHNGRSYVVTRYKGEFMYHQDIANKCLALIQSRWEEYKQGLCQFRIEEFTGKGWTDVLDFYEEWLQEVIEPNRKPGTTKSYRSYLNNWIKPFFEMHPVRMHEIQLDTLTKFMNFIQLTGKGKHNVVMALRSCMDYAWRSKRIPEMPPFPKRAEFGIVEPEFDWLWEAQQMEVINTIPEDYRPPFLWLKHHYRRPGEACALFKTDYDQINNAFWIRRTISNKQLVSSTKTGKAHYVPCHSDFVPIARRLIAENPHSPFMFVNSRAKNPDSSYTIESLNNVWNAACRQLGVKIKLYHGTKHSSCTQFINEKGGSDIELQMLTDHARLDSVKKYRIVGLERKRELLERRKVIDLNYYKTTTDKKVS